MGSPATAINRFDLSLAYSEFSLEANRRGFVGPLIMPPVPVALQSASFLKICTGDLLTKKEDTRRAPKGTYKQDDFEWTTDNYAVTEHGVEEPLDDWTLRRYRNEIMAEQIHGDRAVNRLLQAYEHEVAEIMLATATFPDGAGTDWSTPGTGTPITDINAAIAAVETASGQTPNTLLLTKTQVRRIKLCDEVTDLLKYSGRDDPKQLGTVAMLQDLFDIERVIIANGFKNTADRGQTASLSRIWDDTKAIVCCTHTSPDLESPGPRVGATIMWSEENGSIPGSQETEIGVLVEEYRQEGIRGSVLRARNNYQIKVLHPETAYILTGLQG